MADKPLPWFRLYSELAGDKKIPVISRMTGLSKVEIIGAFTILMCIANESPERGKLLITSNIEYKFEDIAAELQFKEQSAEELLKCFVLLEMIDIDENGVMFIRNWNKRQYKSDDSSDRVTKHRMKHKSNGDVTLHESYGNARVTPPDTDPDTDTESDNNNTGDIFRLYENNISMLTPILSDRIGEWIDNYPTDWIKEAIEAAVNNGVRKPNYIDAILKRWQTDGRTNGKKKWIPEEHATEVYE